ncbi:MAG: symmetrical bis(5'-nucleosyl)-tetraphosphatase [Alteromonadaceae bacterium]|nr:symmetrical bis(5'-nucleosyl)-tetraphosphatase [Alteromonadaceae bacterium]
MAIYIVGDIQGCFSELEALLNKVNFVASKDELWLAGDIVARGPDSLATIRFIKSLGQSAKMVLGNHDLHLLAIHAGLKKAKKQDLLDELLAAPDLDELMNWLARQPLIQKIPGENAYMTHAGISPQWTIEEAVEQAESAHEKLSSENRNKWLACMYGNLPNDWQQAKGSIEKFRYTINAFTRMRYCNKNKTLELHCKEALTDAPSNLMPWFELSNVLNNTNVIFGHWATLMGQCPLKNVYALDTGCVWGNYLTMLRWGDKQRFTEKSHKYI